MFIEIDATRDGDVIYTSTTKANFAYRWWWCGLDLIDSFSLCEIRQHVHYMCVRGNSQQIGYMGIGIYVRHLSRRDRVS
jgi:hypothetical protein